MSEFDYRPPVYRSEPWRLRDPDLLGRTPDERTFLMESIRRSFTSLIARLEAERYRATHDDLTGALNRRGLEEFWANSGEPKAVAVLSADATNLKAVNDIVSHQRGDEVIRETYKILRRSTRPTDVIARVGGDEFVVVLNAEDSEPGHEIYNRRHLTLGNEELISVITERIAAEVGIFLNEHKDLEKMGFDLAVGGAQMDPDKTIDETLREAESQMVVMKEAQHQTRGAHRPQD